jgi:hypothetical protein
MNDDIYNRWVQRADAEAPADFADRVMDAVRRDPPPRSKGVPVFLSLPAVRVAVCVLASVACLYRMAAVVAVFFPQ